MTIIGLCRPPVDPQSAALPRSSAQRACWTPSCRCPATRARPTWRGSPASIRRPSRASSRRWWTPVTSSTCRSPAATGSARTCCSLSNHVLAGLDLRAVARAHLIELEAETGETATLSVPGERDAVTVDFVPSRASVASVAPRRPAEHRPRNGDREGRPGLRAASRRGRARALHAAHDRRSRRARARDRRGARPGLGAADGEREADLNAIAAPVFGVTGGLVAIVGLQGPASRFDADAQTAALPTLERHAAAVSRALGHKGSAGVNNGVRHHYSLCVCCGVVRVVATRVGSSDRRRVGG